MTFLSFLLFGELILQVSGSDVKVKPGDSAVLPCLAPAGAAVTVLEWTKPDLQSEDYVFFYRNRRLYENYQHQLFKGRVELKDLRSLKDGDVSVVLKNVTREDMGTYKCRVLLGNRDGEHSETINLITETDSDEHVAAGIRGETTNQGFIPINSILIGLIVAAAVVVVVVVVAAAVVVTQSNMRQKCKSFQIYL